ncbi:hypothetical protein ABFV74_18545 [Pseudoalteromonas distincta]|uniref:hypothetical protein n=1 Tax=Pseudoalteromonas distincta TaxID=77608 RepID=UPI003218217C
MARRKNNSSEFINMLFEITGHLWQVGLFISMLLWALAGYLLNWGYGLHNKEHTTVITSLFEKFSVIFYIPFLLALFFAVVFSFKTYQTFKAQSNY